MERVDGSTTPVITTSVHSDIINTHILPKLDGPTLASTSCTSSELQTLCSDHNLWKNICDSAWPSTTDPRVQDIISTFPSGHRSFFADSFPAFDYHHQQQPKSKNRKISAEEIKPELLSAVDIHIGDQLLYSKVLVKEDMPGWYTNSFLRLNLLEGYEYDKVTKPVIKVNDGEENECIKFLEEKMKLSCIMIDPTRKRAVNLSSQAPMMVQKHWMCKEYIQVHYGMVMASSGVEGGFARFEVTVVIGERKLKGGELEVIQISMKVEDLEGRMMSGKDSLVILQEAMDRRRTKRGIDEEKKRYEDFLKMRGIYREENKNKRMKISDMVWIAIGYTMFTAFWTLMIYSFLFGCACVGVGSWVRQLLFKRSQNERRPE